MSNTTRSEVDYLLKQAGSPERLNLNRRRFAPGIDLSGLDLHGAQLAGPSCLLQISAELT